MIETSRERINIGKKIAEKKEIIFVEGDMIIPDAKPDILKPICLSGIPIIYKKEIMEGKIRIDGNINTYIMYLANGEKNETRGINTSLDFSEIIEVQNSTEGSNMNLETKIKSIECKIINERKISLKAALEVTIQMNANEELEIISDINQTNNIQILKEEMKINALIGGGSTRIHGKETIPIDSEENLAEILKANVSLIDKDIKISYNKVLVKTDVEIRMLYLTEENNIRTVVGKVPIVGFIDIQDITENSICDVNYEIKNIIIKPNNSEEHSIYVELEAEIECQAYEEKSVNIIRDVYSPYQNISINMRQMNTISKKKIVREKNQIKQNITIEQIEQYKILDVEATPMVQKESRMNTDLKYECEMELKLILFNTQTFKVEIKTEKIPFEFATKILEDENVSTNVELEVGTQDYIVQTNNEVSCNVDVMFSIGVEKNDTIQVISNLEEDGERDMQDYSVIIYIVKPGDTLWKIAKKFGSTIDDIVRTNGIEDPNRIMAGQKIFIPRFYKGNRTQAVAVNSGDVIESKVAVAKDG